jgi:hypothetical protein
MLATNETLCNESKSFKYLFEELSIRMEEYYDNVKIIHSE